MNVARRALRVSGAPARAALIGLIKLYRLTLSGLLGGQCRFYPTCSVYAESVIRSRGATVGVILSTWRILRCNPFGKGGLDPSPPARDEGGTRPANDISEHETEYETVIRHHHQGVSV